MAAHMHVTQLHACLQYQHAGCDAKRDQVGHRIKLCTKIGCCLKKSSGQAVHDIEQATPDDHPAGQFQIAEHTGDD